MRWHALLWMAVLAVVAAWAPMTLDWPFFRDHGVLAWAGHVVAQGGLPYRDAWDVKGPLVYYLFAAIEGAFGVNQWGVRLADLLVVGSTAGVLAVAGHRLGGPVAAGYAACIYLVHHLALDYRSAAQPDGWGSLPIAAALLCLLGPGGTRSGLRMGLAGTLIGTAALLKPTFAVFIVAPLAAGIADRHPGAPRALGATALGFLMPLAVALGWFAARGALGDLADVQIAFNLGPYAGLLPTSPAWHLTNVLEFLARPAEALAVALAAAAGYQLLRERPAAGVLLVAALAASAASVMVQQKYFGYHWQAVFVPLALLAGVGLASLWPRERVVAGAAALLLLGVPLRETLWSLRRWQQRAAAPELAREYQAGFGEYGDTAFRKDTDAAVELLRSRGSGHERLLVWGHQAGLNYRSGLDAPTRFGYALPLIAEPDTPLRRRYRARFLADLSAIPPHWIVVVTQDSTGLLGASSHQALARFPEFARVLARDYVLDTVVGRYEVLVRRDTHSVMLGGSPTSED